jgi:hypothetical protein
LQCRLTNASGDAVLGSYLVEFFDASGRRLSSTSSRPYSMIPGAPFLIEARAGSASAERIVISIR